MARQRSQGRKAQYEIRPVGESPGARQGRVAVGGHELVGVYDTRARRFVLTPPDAVAGTIAGDHAVVLALRRRARRSGVSRDDFDWIVESCQLDGDAPLSRYKIQDRDTIAWCWPTGIGCVARAKYRRIAVACRSEDYRTWIYVVQRADGSYFETRDRQAALAASHG